MNTNYTLLFPLLLILLTGCASMEKVVARISEKTGKAAEVTTAFTSQQKVKLDERTAKVSEASKKLDIQEATPEQEAQIGRESASVLLGAAPLLDDREVMSYLNALGGWIALQTGRTNVNWRFGVLDSPNVNAFAAPDGYVFITRGLFRKLNNESELAGVIAHEMAHVIKRHYIVALRKTDKMGAVGNLAAAGVEVVGISGKAVNPVFNLAQNVYSSGLDKGDEYEADRLGVVYAARAGYDPYGLPRVLTMYAANAGREGFDLLFSTHPSPQNRLEKLGKVMGDTLAAFESTGLNDSPQFRHIQSLL